MSIIDSIIQDYGLEAVVIVAGAFGSAITGLIIFVYRFIKARRALRVQQLELEDLRLRVKGELDGQTINGLKEQIQIARGHLEDRKQALKDLDEEIKNWERNRAENPKRIEQKKNEIRNLQSRQTSLEKELKEAQTRLSELSEERGELEKLVRKTDYFIKSRERKIQDMIKVQQTQPG